MRWLVAAAALALAAVPAARALDESSFRWERPLEHRGAGPVAFEPDGPLFAHARDGFADLRIVDAAGGQVPWRVLPEAALTPEQEVPLLNSGREGNAAVALLDRGPGAPPIDRLELRLPDEPFVGRVEVLGADRRTGTYTLLSSTAIYDLRGARPARSTVALLPRTDFRFLRVRVTGAGEILGASVAGRAKQRTPDIVETPPLEVEQRERSTVATLDLGWRDVPVDELRLSSTTERFDRPVAVAGSNDGESFVPLAGGRVFRFGGAAQTAIPLAAAHRWLRVTIENGDDPPLDGLAVETARLPRTLLAEGGHEPPYRLLYGNPRLGPPEYDFAELPPGALDLESASPAALGREARNASFRPPADTRSFAERNSWVVQGALALAAIVVAVGGFLALRRRT